MGASMLPDRVAETVSHAQDSGQHPAVVGRTEAAPAPQGGGMQLFRSEVIAERQTQFLGTVLLTPRLSDQIFTIAAVIFAAAIIGLLFFGEFTRKAHINGWLVPQDGLMRVFTPQAGVITSMLVHEGQPVREGDRLLTLSAEMRSSALGATQEQIVRQLEQRSAALGSERVQRERLLAQQRRDYGARLAALKDEREQISQDIELMRSRIALSEENVQMNRELHQQGFISRQRLQMVEGDQLEQQTRLGNLKRQRIALEREQAQLEGELKDLPLKTGAEIAGIERNIASVEQERAEAEARREIVVLAPQDGTVTAILAELGGQAHTASPLLS